MVNPLINLQCNKIMRLENNTNDSNNDDDNGYSYNKTIREITIT